METKICRKCGEEKDSKCFSVDRQNKDGLKGECKTCASTVDKLYREANAEKIAAKSKLYYETYPERRKLYYEAHTEYHKEYYKKNAEKIAARNKLRREANGEYQRLYYEANPEKLVVRNKLYREANPERNRIDHQRRMARKKELPCTFTLSQWNATKEHFNNQCAYCGEDKPLEQEHFVALSKGGEYTLNNIIPACKSCNSSKGNSDMSTWYRKQTCYSAERENMILAYLL